MGKHAKRKLISKRIQISELWLPSRKVMQFPLWIYLKEIQIQKSNWQKFARRENMSFSVFLVRLLQDVLRHISQGKVRMLADTCGDFAKAADLTLDLSKVLGSVRSKRFSILVEDGKAVKVNIEPDGTGLTCSLAKSLL